jgi:small subunit ribosomal protein S9
MSRLYGPNLIANCSTAGTITRDPRKVERKKPGHVKARKMPTWVKR